MHTITENTTTLSVSPQQLGLLHHTLGLSEFQRSSNRNHFLSGAGHHDQANLELLTAAGLMSCDPAPSWTCGETLFRVTEAGRTYAMANLPPVPAPVKRSNYENYLHADFGCNFAEYLGIEVPRREFLGRKVRLVTSKATGDYAATLKEAKVSYKKALAAHQATRRPARSQPAAQPA